MTALNRYGVLKLYSAGVQKISLSAAGNSYLNMAGNLGIGTTTPSSKLHVNGDIRANAYYYNSDRRYKSDISLLNNSLDNILALNGYTYTLKSTGKKSIGIIAQEVEKVYPTLVATDAQGY